MTGVASAAASDPRAGAREYYFAYCETGFDARDLGDLQLVLVRSGEAQ